MLYAAVGVLLVDGQVILHLVQFILKLHDARTIFFHQSMFRHRTFHTDSYILHRREGKAKTERRWEEKRKRRSKYENSLERVPNERLVQNKSEARESEIPVQVVLEESRQDGNYRKPFKDSNLGSSERERGDLSRKVGERKCRQSSTRHPPPPPSSPPPPPLAPPRSNDLSPPRVPPRPSDDLPQRRGGGGRGDEVARRLEGRVVRLEEELREGRRRVEASEEEGRRLRKKVGGKEGEKLEEQGREVANVTLLLLGLTRRLAKLEVEGGQGFGGGKGEEERRRRRRRLQEQVEEAKQLRNNIARRSLKVFCYLFFLIIFYFGDISD